MPQQRGGQIDTVKQEARLFPPPAEFAARARIGSLAARGGLRLPKIASQSVRTFRICRRQGRPARAARFYLCPQARYGPPNAGTPPISRLNWIEPARSGISPSTAFVVPLFLSAIPFENGLR